LGLILSDDQMKTGALASAVNTEFQDAIKGNELQVGTRLGGGLDFAP
jgi:hypothetical protein